METWKYQLTVAKLQKQQKLFVNRNSRRSYILLPEGENQWQSTGLLRYAKNHMI